MKPAFSVIFLTTLIGAGQGLFLALFTHQSYALFGLLPMQSDPFYGYGSALALSLLVGGLIASFFHLGRPERAWRSATQWRTSWLSREVIVLPAFMGVVFLFGVSHLAGYRPADTDTARWPGHRSVIRTGRRWHDAGLCIVRLHGHDLRLPAFPARMAFAAHRGELSS